MHISSWFVNGIKIRSVHYLILIEKFVFTVSTPASVASVHCLSSPQPLPISPMLHFPSVAQLVWPPELPPCIPSFWILDLLNDYKQICGCWEARKPWLIEKIEVAPPYKVEFILKIMFGSLWITLLFTSGKQRLFKNVNGYVSDSSKFVYFGESDIGVASKVKSPRNLVFAMLLGLFKNFNRFC